MSWFGREEERERIGNSEHMLVYTCLPEIKERPREREFGMREKGRGKGKMRARSEVGW